MGREELRALIQWLKFGGLLDWTAGTFSLLSYFLSIVYYLVTLILESADRMSLQLIRLLHASLSPLGTRNSLHVYPCSDNDM